MHLDLGLRIAALALFLVIIAISGSFRAVAQARGGALPAGDPGGQPSPAARLVITLAVFGGVLFPAIGPGAVPWLLVPLPDRLRWLGIALLAAGALLLGWTMRSLGTSVSASTATRAGARLVTSGPYRVVRHPLYTAGMLAYLGLALALRSVPMFVVTAIIAAWLPWRVRAEERNLVRSYGDRYRQYMTVTGRFLPRLR
jgi:protein-S-isoprenylcysteine O-methyltransferase